MGNKELKKCIVRFAQYYLLMQTYCCRPQITDDGQQIHHSVSIYGTMYVRLKMNPSFSIFVEKGLIYLELCLSRAVTGRPRLFYCLNLPQKHRLGNFVLDSALYPALQFDDGFLQREATVKIPLWFINDADQ